MEERDVRAVVLPDDVEPQAQPGKKSGWDYKYRSGWAKGVAFADAKLLVCGGNGAKNFVTRFSVGSPTPELHRILQSDWPLNDELYDVAPAIDGGMYTVGYCASNTPQPAAWATRIDSRGNILWSKALAANKSNYNMFDRCHPLPDGGLLASGWYRTEDTFGPMFGFVVRFRSDGVVAWRVDLPRVSNVADIAVVGDQSLILWNSAGYNATLERRDSAGKVVWRSSLTLDGHQIGGRPLTVDVAGNVYVSYDALKSSDPISMGKLRKFNPNGAELWLRSIPQLGPDGAGNHGTISNLAFCPEGRIVGVGAGYRPGPERFSFLVEWNLEGERTSIQELPMGGLSRIDAGSEGRVAAVGASTERGVSAWVHMTSLSVIQEG